MLPPCGGWCASERVERRLSRQHSQLTDSSLTSDFLEHGGSSSSNAGTPGIWRVLTTPNWKKKTTHKTLTYSHLFEFLGLAPKLELTHIIFPGFCVISLPVGMCFFKEIFPVCVKCGFIRYWHKQTTRGSSPVTPSYGLKYILSIKNNNSLDLYLDSDGMSFFTCLEWFVLQEGAHDTVSAGTDCQ